MNADISISEEINKLNLEISKKKTKSLKEYQLIIDAYPDAKLVQDANYSKEKYICSEKIVKTKLFYTYQLGMEIYLLPFEELYIPNVKVKTKIYFTPPMFLFYSINNTIASRKFIIGSYYKMLLSYGFTEELCKACDSYIITHVLDKYKGAVDSTFASDNLKRLLIFL